MTAEVLHLLGRLADTLRAQAADEDERELFDAALSLSRYFLPYNKRE